MNNDKQLDKVFENALLSWINAEAEFFELDRIADFQELKDGLHLHAIASRTNFKNGLLMSGENKLESVINFLIRYYENDIVSRINFENIQRPDCNLELAKIVMLLLNGVLVSDPKKHVNLCDRLEKPFPSKILEMVQRLNIRDQDQDVDCFDLLYKKLDSGSDEVTKKLKFETPRHSPVKKIDKASSQKFDVVPRSSSVENRSISRNITASKSLIKLPIESPRKRSVSPINRTTGFPKIGRIPSDNNSPVSSRGSPLSKLSGSPKVQFQRQIREKGHEIKMLRQQLNEREHTIDNLRTESENINQKLMEMTEQLNRLKRAEVNCRRLELELDYAKKASENSDGIIQKTNQSLEQLKSENLTLKHTLRDMKNEKDAKQAMELELDEAGKKLSAKDETISKLNNRINEMKVAESLSQEHEKQLQNEIVNLKNQNSNLQQTMKDKLDELEYLTENYNRAKSAEENFRNELMKKETTFRELESELSKERDQFNKERDQFSKERCQFNDSINSMANETKSLNCKVDDLISQVCSLEQKNDEKSEMAHQTFQELQQCRQEKFELAHEKEILQKNLEEVRLKFLETEKRVVELQEKNSKAYNAEKELCNKLKQLEEEKIELSSKLAAKCDELTEEKRLHAAIKNVQSILKTKPILPAAPNRTPFNNSQLTFMTAGTGGSRFFGQPQILDDGRSLKSVSSAETFQSVRSNELLCRREFGCDDEPDIMVENSVTPVAKEKDQTAIKDSKEAPLVLTEKQIAILTQQNSGESFIDFYRPTFKRPTTPTTKLNFDDNASLAGHSIHELDNENHVSSTPYDWSRRLTILHDRNQHQPAHLKCSYPVETQSLPDEVKELDLKYSLVYNPPESINTTANAFGQSSTSATKGVGKSSAKKKLKIVLKGKAVKNLADVEDRKKSDFRSPMTKIKRFWSKDKTISSAAKPQTPEPTNGIVPENVRKTNTCVSYSIANSAHKSKKKLKCNDGNAQKTLQFSSSEDSSTLPSTSSFALH